MDAVNRGELLKFRKSHAIIIGIDDYDRAIGKLSTPVLDATRFKDVLIKNQGFKEEDIQFLKDPTKAEIDALLTSLTASGNAEEEEDEVFDITRKDCLVFYYAGHGVAGDLPEEGEEKGPAGYLLPKDAALQTAKLVDNSTLIKMETVFDALNRVNAHHTLLILDCCFAGAFRRVNQTRGQVGLAFRPMTETRFERYKQKRAWQVLASAGPAETAADWISERGDGSTDRIGKGKLRARHSPFAMALFEALGGLGNVDVKPQGKSLGDGVITSSELFLFLHDRVEKITRADKSFKPQNPSLFPLGKDDGGQFIFVDPRHPKNAPDWATLKRSNPYKGLNQFDIVDSPFYYGREKDIDKVLTAMKWEEEENGPPILMITGASGSGKSSFVKAGILSRYWEKEIGSGDQKQREYQLFQLRPGAKPWIIKEYEEEEWKDSYALREHLFNLPQAISPSLIGANSPLDPTQKQILLIDQYEELFTACTAAERTALDQALLELLREAMKPEGQLKLFLTIRSDFEWQLEISALGQFYWPERNVYYHLCRLNSLGLDELRDVLINPAMVLAYDFEEQEQTNLVDIILDDLDYLPSALPLLSYTMQLLAEKTSKLKRVFLIDTYQKDIGGVAGAMQNRLQEVYGGLSSAEQLLMKQLLLRMVNLSDGEYTRRRLFRFPQVDELQFVKDPAGDAITSLLEKLVEAQLILTDEVEDIPFVELVHDSLINTGSTCKLWIQEFGKENLLLQRQLWGAVKEYHSNEEAVTFLWDKNPKISQLRAIVDSEINWLNVKELDFVEKSWQRRLDEIVRIKKQRDEAWATALAARGQQYSFTDLTHGIRIAQAAYERIDPPIVAAEQSIIRTYYATQAEGVYQHAFTGHEKMIWEVAFIKNGEQVVSAGQDGTIKIWDVKSGQLIKNLDQEGLDRDLKSIYALAASNDGEMVVVGSPMGHIKVWKVESGEMEQFSALTSSAYALAISSDKRYIVAGGTNGELRIFGRQNDTSPYQFKQTLRGHKNLQITAIDFSHDDQFLLTGGDGGKLIKWQFDEATDSWGLVSGWPIEIGLGIKSAVFSSDGTYIAVSMLGKKANAQLRDGATGVLLQNYIGHTDHVYSISFSADDAQVLTGSWDTFAILWDRDSGDRIKTFHVPNSSVNAAALSKDGNFVVTASHDKIVRLWLAKKEDNIFGQHDTKVEALSLSKEETFLMTRVSKRVNNLFVPELKIWRTTDQKVHGLIGEGVLAAFLHQSSRYLVLDSAGQITIHDVNSLAIEETYPFAKATCMAISPNDEQLLIGQEDGTLKIRFLRRRARNIPPFEGHTRGIEAIAFAPDGKSFISGSSDKTAKIWDIETGTAIDLKINGADDFTHLEMIEAVAFAPNGLLAFTGSRDHTVKIWEAETGIWIRTIQVKAQVAALAISPDGKSLLTSSWDHSIHQWHIETGELIGRYPSHTRFIQALVYAKDGKRFYSAASDAKVRLWLSPRGIYEYLQTAPIYQLNEVERKQYGLEVKFDE